MKRRDLLQIAILAWPAVMLVIYLSYPGDGEFPGNSGKSEATPEVGDAEATRQDLAAVSRPEPERRVPDAVVLETACA